MVVCDNYWSLNPKMKVLDLNRKENLNLMTKK